MKRIAFVGGVGAGKTTLFNALQGNYTLARKTQARASKLTRSFWCVRLQELQGEPVQPAGKQYRSRKGKHPGHQNAGHGFTL